MDGRYFLSNSACSESLPFLKHLLHVQQHALADAGNGQHFLGFADQVGDLLRLRFNGFGGVAVRADAERILAVDFEQVGGFIENAGNGFVVHVR